MKYTIEVTNIKEKYSPTHRTFDLKLNDVLFKGSMKLVDSPTSKNPYKLAYQLKFDRPISNIKDYKAVRIKILELIKEQISRVSTELWRKPL
jgi:hypothetical protein